MKYLFSIAVASVFIAFPQTGDAQETLSELNKRQFELINEERSLAQQIAMFEEQSKAQEDQISLLKQRLDLLNSTPGAPQQAPGATPKPEEAGPDNGTAPGGDRQAELISSCKNYMVFIEAKDGRVCTAFLGSQEGKARVFASAPWVAEAGNFSVSDLNGIPMPITQELSCPIGTELLGLHPQAADLPHFDLAAENALPSVGEPILVVLVDAKSKELSSVAGAIRGIGPDTLELDAELTPEMGGAPVLSMESGKLIGIVAHQVAGVADDWAVGTRHEGSRNFALRLDRIKEWEKSDLGRFAKEAAYIRGINRKTMLGWTAHTLMDCELEMRRGRPSYSPSSQSTYRDQIKEWEERRAEVGRLKAFAMEYADKHPSDPQIKKALAWVDEFKKPVNLAPGSELDQRRSGIYQLILADLKTKEPDLSAHLSSYHKSQYKAAMQDRLHGIEIATENGRRIGQ